MTRPAAGVRATTLVAAGVVLALVLAAVGPAAWALEVGARDTGDIDVDTDTVSEATDAVLGPAKPSDESEDEEDDADAAEAGTTSDIAETVDSTVEEATGIEVDPASDDDPDANGTTRDVAETDESTNDTVDEGTDRQGALTGNEDGGGDGADSDPEMVDESDDRPEAGTETAGGDEEATGEGSTGRISRPASNQEPGAPIDLEPETPVNPITPDATTPANHTWEAVGRDVRSVEAEDAGLSIADKDPVAADTANEPLVAGPAEARRAARFHVAQLLTQAFGRAVGGDGAPAVLRVELMAPAMALLLVVAGAHVARFAEVRHRL